MKLRIRIDPSIWAELLFGISVSFILILSALIITRTLE